MKQILDLSSIFRELNTKDLHLRTPVLTDADSMFAMLSDAETVKYWSNQPAKDSAEALRKLNEDLESAALGNSISWALSLHGEHKMIGKCVLFQFDQSNHRAEIGFILNRAYWRRGLMQQALEVVIKFGFEELKLHRLEADVDPGNTGSLAILEKLGFEREGFFRERWLICGDWKDSVMLGLLSPA